MSPNDKQLVTIRTHDRDPNLVYLDTPPTLASTMGRFNPAQFVGARHGAYVVTVDQLPAFIRFAELSHIVVNDNRGTIATDRPYGRERPLPECAVCGQPARRGTRLAYCPNCGEEWHPVEPVPAAYEEAATIECGSCGSRVMRGFAHCGRCGAALDELDDIRPVLPRGHLDDPLPIGAVLAELPIELPPSP